MQTTAITAASKLFAHSLFNYSLQLPCYIHTTLTLYFFSVFSLCLLRLLLLISPIFISLSVSFISSVYEITSSNMRLDNLLSQLGLVCLLGSPLVWGHRSTSLPVLFRRQNSCPNVQSCSEAAKSADTCCIPEFGLFALTLQVSYAISFPSQ